MLHYTARRDLRDIERRAATPASEHFDLVVIGGGPAGACGANAAALFGRRVALVERAEHVGGAGINSGTVPSKTLRETALALSGFRSRRLFGVDLSLRREATAAELMHHKDAVSDAERRQVERRMLAFGVQRFHGVGRFVDPHTVAVTSPRGGTTLLHGDVILIATGSVPWRPPEFPFDDDRVHDSDQLLDIRTVPKSLAVVGAGVIGAEYASTFAAIGVAVHVVDGRDTLLPFLDADASRALEAAMVANGVHFHWRERVERCDASRPDEIVLHLSSGAELACEHVLVCAGRSSNVGDLDLAAAGIDAGERGLIHVDARWRTAVPHVFAAGDVIGPPALAATGMEQARAAMCHAFDVAAKGDAAPLLATGIYTIPEAGAVGATEQALRDGGVDYIAGVARYADHARGRIVGDDVGFLKLLFRQSDMRLLGAHAVGEHATELIHIALVAMMSDATAELFNRACFNYPTLGDLYKYATYDALLAKGDY
ncbi:MAG TPA: Si-specific NAD(P)(+) transhydrogenase [Pseudomonadales bacterium]|nr:Si-specific NAD(P)(+) transhydrogenase [Pseudomonadales bacterium]